MSSIANLQRRKVDKGLPRAEGKKRYGEKQGVTTNWVQDFFLG